MYVGHLLHVHYFLFILMSPNVRGLPNKGSVLQSYDVCVTNSRECSDSDSTVFPFLLLKRYPSAT